MDINQDKNQGKIKNYIADQITINNALAPPVPLIEIPQNIPYIGTDIFVGRVKELENIDKILDKNQSLAITSVTGMGGVGKTELAVQYAFRYQQNYSGGICWIEAKRSDIMGQIISFCQSVDINPPDYLQTIQDRLNYCWNHWLEGDVLLIFDDVQSYKNIKNSLPKNNNFKVIITSRQKLGRLKQLKLQVLQPAESLEILRQIVGEERVNNELEKANHLCEWLGYLPLGLELVGRYIYNDDFLSIEETLELLNGEKLAAEALLNPDEDEGDMTAQLGVAAAFNLSWDKLSAEGKKLGCYLSLFGADLFEWSWVESSNVYDAEILNKARRDDLLKYDLLQVNKEEDRDKPLLSYHPLVYQYFASKFQELEDKEELKHKFCKSLIPVAKSIGYYPTLKEIKKFKIAVPHLEMIATAMRDDIDDEDIILPFIGLGRFYEGQTNYQVAERWRKDCLTVCQEFFGEEHSHVSVSMNNLALLYHLQGKYEAAEPLLVEGLAMDKKLLGCEHLDVAVSMNNLAELYKLQGKLEEAKKIFVDALAMKKKLLGDEHREVALSMNNLAELYTKQGKYEAAESGHKSALAMFKKLLDKEHPLIATSMNNLAIVHKIQGNYKKAEILYINALAMRKKLLGEEHTDVADSMNNLAELYTEQRKYKKAEPLYVEALAITKKRLGEEHPSVALSMKNLAFLYKLQGNYKEAETLYKDSLAMTKKFFGEEHIEIATSMNNLAGLYDAKRECQEAETLYINALDMKKKLLGEEHSSVALSMNNLAFLYYSQGKYEAAKPLYVDALEMTKMFLGEEHPSVATSMNNLALLYESQGKYEAAEPLYVDALEMTKMFLGEEHPSVATSMNNLAGLYRTQGKYEAAEPLYIKAINIFENVLGNQHPWTVIVKKNYQIMLDEMVQS